MSLTSAQVKSLSTDMTLMQPVKNIRLPKPVNSTGASSLAAKLDKFQTDPDFANWGIGVVDYTKSSSSPSIWLSDGRAADPKRKLSTSDTPWRAGSTGKIAILLAAAQLRDDVRAIQDGKLLKTPEEFDAFFARADLWQLSPVFRTSQIASGHAPRISTIFDFTKTPADFAGPAVSGPDFIKNILHHATRVKPAHLDWTSTTNFAFSERLWLCGALSDNVAATSCISEIGIGYLKAVQRAYGLFDDANGMHLLLSNDYKPIPAKISVSPGSKLNYRGVVDVEFHHVTDALQTAPGKFTDQSSKEPGSACALLAYLIAFREKKFLPRSTASSNAAFGVITDFLSHGGSEQTQSFIANGVAKAAKVDLQISKIGLLGKADGEPGPLNCEFAYLETHEKSGAPKPRKYGVVVTGIKHRVDSTGTVTRAASTLTEDLGEAIHRALSA